MISPETKAIQYSQSNSTVAKIYIQSISITRTNN